MPISGKLKNRLRENNIWDWINMEEEKKVKVSPTVDNKKNEKKKKGVELFDKDGNKYDGKCKETEPDVEKYELYDKF